jgi:predicted enzyme related to lactoylglutathione lyase
MTKRAAHATVTETFFAIEVADIHRATAFYRRALGAEILFESARWTSIRLAGVRLGLALVPGHTGGRNGLHLAVTDLPAAREAITAAGGVATAAPVEVAPGVVIVEVGDTEGNRFILRTD